MKKKLKSNQKRVTWVNNLFFAVLLVLSCAAPVNAGLTYSGFISSEEDNTGLFLQTQSHSVNLGLRQQLTNFVAVDEAVRYSYRLVEPLPQTEQLLPSIDLVNANLLYRFNLSALSTMNLDNNDKIADNSRYEIGFKSQWQSNLVPSLQVVASQRNDLQTVGASSFGENETNSLSTTLDWHRDALGLYYNNRWTEDFDLRGDLIETTTSHNANLEFDKGFWGNKLHVGFKQVYSETKEVRGEASTSEGLIPQTILEVRTGYDNTPADSAEDPLVVATPAMQDGILTIAYPVASNTSFNNIILALAGQVDLIYLYTTTDLGAAALGLTWNLFTNDFLGTTWDPATFSSGVTYNSVRQRFEIKVDGLSVNYLKLVLDIPLAGPAIDFTEVLVFDSRITVTSEKVTLNTNSNTSLNLSSRLSRDWFFNYRTDLAVNEIERASPYEREQLGHGGNLKYSSADGSFFSVFSFTMSRGRIVRLGVIDENENTTYAVDLNKQFLPTLSAGIGWDRNEFSVNSVRTAERFSYRLDSHAQLYPDLDLDLQVDVSESENFQSLSKSNSVSGDVTLASRLYPGLFLSLAGRYADSEPGAQVYTSDLIMQWRPSDDLSFSGGVSYIDDNSIEYKQFISRLDIDLVLTEGILLTTDYSATKAEKLSQVGKLSLNWYLKKGLRLEGGCRYRDVSNLSGKDLTVFGNMAINFAMP